MAGPPPIDSPPLTPRRHSMPELTLASILGWAICGLVVGVLARVIVPGPNPMGVLGTMLLGIVGSFVGGLIAYALNLGTTGAPTAWFLSVIGAVLALWLVFGVGGERRTA